MHGIPAMAKNNPLSCLFTEQWSKSKFFFYGWQILKTSAKVGDFFQPGFIKILGYTDPRYKHENPSEQVKVRWIYEVT